MYNHQDIPKTVLVHLAAGLGNIVLATPLVLALSEMGFVIDIRLDADYPATLHLFDNWSAVRSIQSARTPRPLASYHHVVPSVPPFYWARFASLYRGSRNVLTRPPDSLFACDEQSWYFRFARQLDYTGAQPSPSLPIAPSLEFGITASTVVLAPGCKTGEMTAKRWPWFAQLAARLPDVAISGTRDDIANLEFPPQARSFVDRLTLVETASLLASAGLVVANDSGLAHLAAACGTPTLMLFGPTSDRVLGAFPAHVTTLRSNLHCEPCWTTARLRACHGQVTCLRDLTVDTVLAIIEQKIHATPN